MKRNYIVLLTLVAIITGLMMIPGITNATKMTNYNKQALAQQGFEDRAKKSGIEDAKIEIELKSNKSKIEDLKKVVEEKKYADDSKLKDGATRIKKELVTYEEFVNMYDDIDMDPSIEKDRVVYAVETHYPKGYQHPRGFVKDAIVTVCIDAESGEVLLTSIYSLVKNGNGIKLPELPDTN